MANLDRLLSGMGELHLYIVKIESIEITISSEKGQIPYRETIVCKCVEEYVHKKQLEDRDDLLKLRFYLNLMTKMNLCLCLK